jgi:hypothetical protein
VDQAMVSNSRREQAMQRGDQSSLRAATTSFCCGWRERQDIALRGGGVAGAGPEVLLGK